MKYWDELKFFKGDIKGKKNKFDNNIYSFDIETSSFIELNNVIYPSIKYDELDEDSKDEAIPHSMMYIWMFSINDIVYYGRTWDDFLNFLERLERYVPERKIIFVHNLSFEFQFLKSVLSFKEVFARKSRKVMKATTNKFNLEFRCSYMMSNCALAYLPDLFNLPVKKMVGDLDYSLLRTPETKLNELELGYCKNDCLVVYEYIKMEREQYKNVDRIPLTSTGHVRRELKRIVMKNYSYRNKVSRAVNVNPHVYNMLLDAFGGGYTHANWLYTDEIIKDVDSWDFTSSYPYILVTHRFPGTEFKECHIDSADDMLDSYAYLLKIKFKNLKCKYYNNFISQSKCHYILNGRYDNGRVISADELEITLTDVDFKFFIDVYDCTYEIEESYYSLYKFLPKEFIEFVLEKYVNKTKFKGVEGKEVEYAKEKNKFNSLYGMSVTNLISDRVIYEDESEEWIEEPLTNEEIEEKLEEQKKIGFLSFAYGVWVTAYARYNLLSNMIKLDEYVIYSDTDSLKLKQGYDKNVILNYNESVRKRIEFVSYALKIPIEKFAPKDIKGKERMLGLFDDDGHYERFITQGAKKYAFEKYNKKGELEKGITVSGVPKKGVAGLEKLEDFRDDFVFEYKYTNKNTLMYIDTQEPIEVSDYLGQSYLCKDKSGCCLLPTTYKLGKSLEYASLIDDNSSARARYKE